MKEIKQTVEEIKKAVVGKDDIIIKTIMTILARGHVLLEDIPGVGKTNLALAISKSMSLDYHRIQLTTDVMPSDIVGFTMYNPQKNNFEYKHGIAFCHLLLADEINRTSSKTQAALLELMEEGQMTVDGNTYQLPKPFFVIATQNPFGSAGTQLLPDSQLDRFMVKLSLGYPNSDDEINILKTRQTKNPLEDIISILKPETIIQFQNEIDKIFVSDEIYHYIVSIVETTRHHPYIAQGASPRGSLCLMKMAKACAFLAQRDFVIPDDVKAIVHDVLGHRLILNYDAKMKEATSISIIDDILKEVKEPGID
ncbi:MAG: MoxR family ATPase [Coprobacillus sp.]